MYLIHNTVNYSVNEYKSLKDFFIFFFKSSNSFVFLLLKKKKYNFMLDKSKITNIYIKNTLVNTYLSMTINNKIVFAKSSGSVGFKKKQRRVKAAAYKLGKDLSSVLQSLIVNNKIGFLNIILVGYSRYYRAIVSSIRKAIKSSVRLRKTADNVAGWKSKLKNWRLKKKVIQYFFKKPFKFTKTQLEYEKYLESQLKRSVGMVLFLKKIYDKTSIPHGGIKRSIYHNNNRYW